MFLFNNVTTKVDHGVAWVHVFHQKHKLGSFFTPSNVLDFHDEDKFSYLGRLEEFRLNG